LGSSRALGFTVPSARFDLSNVNDLHVPRVHGTRKTEWDVPERLQGAYVWRGGSARLS
jgi:hypothetical protein